MEPPEFKAHVAVQVAAAERLLVDRIKALHNKHAAEGLLKSGATIKVSARSGYETAHDLAIALINDFEQAKRGAEDPELFEVAKQGAIGFAARQWDLWDTEKLGFQPAAVKAGQVLADQITAEVGHVFSRHLDGLPVEGVERRVVVAAGPRPAWAGLERWAKANPALTALLGVLISLAISVASLLLRK